MENEVYAIIVVGLANAAILGLFWNISKQGETYESELPNWRGRSSRSKLPYQPSRPSSPGIGEGVMGRIEVGSVVRIKSGGPLMTVVRINEDTQEATCKYYNLIWQTEWFPVAALELAKETPSMATMSKRT